MVDRKKLRELMAAATPGPWNIRKDEFDGHDQMIAAMAETLRRGHHVLYFGEHEQRVYPFVTGNGPTSKANAALIAALVNGAPALLDELDVNDEALKAMEDLVAEIDLLKNVIAWARARMSAADAAAIAVMLRSEPA